MKLKADSHFDEGSKYFETLVSSTSNLMCIKHYEHSGKRLLAISSSKLEEVDYCSTDHPKLTKNDPIKGKPHKFLTQTPRRGKIPVKTPPVWKSICRVPAKQGTLFHHKTTHLDKYYGPRPITAGPSLTPLKDQSQRTSARAPSAPPLRPTPLHLV
jgi:hypothetical protein